MSTEPPKVVAPLTHDEKIANAMKSVENAITNKAKAVGKSPELLFGNRVGTGVEKTWQSGKIPSEKDIAKEGLALASGNVVTAGALLTKATKLASRALYLNKIESAKSKLKGDKDLNDEQRSGKLKDFISKLDKELETKANPTESTSQ